MFAKYVQLLPFPSFLNSSPAPLTTPSFSPHAAGGFQCKCTFVSVTHKQGSAKFGQSMLLPGKLSPKLLNAMLMNYCSGFIV